MEGFHRRTSPWLSWHRLFFFSISSPSVWEQPGNKQSRNLFLDSKTAGFCFLNPISGIYQQAWFWHQPRALQTFPWKDSSRNFPIHPCKMSPLIKGDILGSTVHWDECRSELSSRVWIAREESLFDPLEDTDDCNALWFKITKRALILKDTL